MKLPPYSIFPNIIGHRISLRQVHPSDIKDLIEISFYDSIKAETLSQASEMQEKINADYKDGNSIHWCISDNTTNKPVGTCGYYRGFSNEAGELGCVLLPQYREQGFMTAALQLAIQFGINNIGLSRIWAITTKENEKAIKLLIKLDFDKIEEQKNNSIEFRYRIKNHY